MDHLHDVLQEKKPILMGTEEIMNIRLQNVCWSH